VHLLVIRHGIAEERPVWARTGRPDEERPLTARGRRLMRRNVRGLARLVSPDLVASSPLVRAIQTAEIVAAAFGGLELTAVAALAPGGPPASVAAWIEHVRVSGTIALVGHEPDLGELTSWCLAGRGAFVALRKGGACLLELARPAPGTAKLLWSLTPRQLRRLG
jgi:phosphohistidine phosphatase